MDQEESFRFAGREDWHQSEAAMDRTHRRLMWFIWIIVLIIGFGIVWSMVDEAKAQQMCGPFADVSKTLSERFGERVVSTGVTPKGDHIVLVFASAGGKTFTIVIAGVSGSACIVAVGRDWTTEAIEPAGRDS